MDLLEREDALAALAEAYDSATRGQGRVVLVAGEPGIGKTALVARFLEDLDGSARVLSGTCDDLAVPRPLGPIRDLAGAVSPALEEAVVRGAAAHEVQALLVAELELPPRPTVLVLEDVHWADDATFDSITVLGRRIGSLPALLVLTFRAGEVPSGHPLHAALGAIPAAHCAFVELWPLSEQAVAALAGAAAREVYAASGGNPFYVNELLCSGEAGLPRSVATAVLGRAARLDAASRELVELVSLVPNRMPAWILDAVLPGWASAAEEPERRQLLTVDKAYVRFRHELARNAIAASVPVAAARRLHERIVATLVAAAADPTLIVHHAEAAGLDAVVADHVVVAARRAAALGSNRQAYSHYRRALDFADQLPAVERAALLEERAAAAYAVNRIDEAFPLVDEAIRIHRIVGSREAVGRCTRVLSRLHWFAGDGDEAWAKAEAAIAILEPLGETVELARAYSVLSQQAMLAQDTGQGLVWGHRALELATRLGDDATRAHALVNLGTVRAQLDPGDVQPLRDAHEFADVAGAREEAARALGNLGYTQLTWIRPETALAHLQDALAYAREWEVHTLAGYAEVAVAWLRLRQGDWEAAERVGRRALERGATVVQLLAKTVLTELAVRRGDADAEARLDDLSAGADRAGDLQRLTPVLELRVEWALTRGGPMPLERFAQLVETYEGRGGLTGWGGARVAAWAAVAGFPLEGDDRSPLFAAMARGDWSEAARRFGDVGWSYDRALMLSLLDDEESLTEAIGVARELGAEPLARRVARRMRGLGLSVPRGPREATRANPAGLTARQLQVLSLLASGLANAEIADRLVVSPRTAEHHVAAVLAKLGAANRWEAVRRASELGL